MPSHSDMLEDPFPYITFDRTTDEYGEPRYGWFCERCAEGSFEVDLDTARLGAVEHTDEHHRKEQP